MKKIHIFSILAIIIAFGISSCKKDDNLEGAVIPESLSTFAGKTTAPYYVQNITGDKFKIPVGITTTKTGDTKINYSVTSPTGASAAQYTIPNSGSITIPAGKSVDSITVNGLFSGFPGTRRDTLIFKLTGGDLPASAFNSTYTLVLNKFCVVNLASFTGQYTKSFDIQTGSPTYGPYNINCTSATPLTATTGYITVSNFWDVGGSPIRIDLDWTNPANFTTSIPVQPLYVDATYGQATIRPNGTGTFSSCDNTFSTSYTVTVAAGSFGAFTTTIAR